MYELRSLQQNDLAIISENQNRAIFIFATVTVVFLPMSTLTSYWGMNVTEIRSTTWTQEHFWRICGAVAVAMVVMLTLWALKHWWFKPVTKTLRQKGMEMKRRHDAEKGILQRDIFREV